MPMAVVHEPRVASYNCEDQGVRNAMTLMEHLGLSRPGLWTTASEREVDLSPDASSKQCSDPLV